MPYNSNLRLTGALFHDAVYLSLLYHKKAQCVNLTQVRPIFNRCPGVRYALACNIYTSGHIEIILSLPTNRPHEKLSYKNVCLKYDENHV